MQAAIESLSDAQSDADRLDAYNLEGKVDRVLDQMGFGTADAHAKVGSFSGGWKMRIGLGKILLQDPNILLLDEPTNHLDLESVEWLEQFLSNQNIPMVIVSHDREFLDRVCTKIVDTVSGVTFSYDGNYSRFLKLKKARMDAWKKVRWFGSPAPYASSGVALYLTTSCHKILSYPAIPYRTIPHRTLPYQPVSNSPPLTLS